MVLVNSRSTQQFDADHSFKLWSVTPRVRFKSKIVNCPMTEFIQVSTTVNNKQEAEKIVRKLLDERLASCVQVLGPINSKYWWRGKIDRAREWICLIKARTKDYSRIEELSGARTL